MTHPTLSNGQRTADILTELGHRVVREQPGTRLEGPGGWLQPPATGVVLRILFYSVKEECRKHRRHSYNGLGNPLSRLPIDV